MTRIGSTRLAIAFSLLLTVGAGTFGDTGPTWFDGAWPYRVQIDCPAGEGDVVCATVMLGGRTTTDGREVRITDYSGVPQVFRVVYHDPQFKSLIKIKVPPGEAKSVWLYFGNINAPRLFDPQLEPEKVQRALAQWRRDQLERAKALRVRSNAVQRLAQMQGRLGQARARDEVSQEEVDQIQKRIEELQQEVEQIHVPPESPRPQVSELWETQRGILLKVFRKTKQVHPRLLKNMHDAIDSGTIEGADFRTNISDGFNPFGESDQYISQYEGYLNIDVPGEYRFCSSSDEGSWVAVNDRLILSWPGPHSWGGSQKGQKNGKITLERGVAKVRYYHEEGTGQQLAFLGWKPPGADHFTAIPDTQWVPVRRGTVMAYEGYRKPFVAVPDVTVASTDWLRGSDARQTSLVRLVDPSVPNGDTSRKLHWAFGDGLDQTGNDLRHVYFRTFRPEVSLTVTNEHGIHDAVTISPPIFNVNVKTAQFPFGKADQYAKVAAEYDVKKLNRPDLVGCAWFWFHLERWPLFLEAARSLLERFPDDTATVELAGGAAEALLRPKYYGPQSAQELLKLAVGKATDDKVRQRLSLQLAKLLAWNLDRPVPAETIYRQQLAASPKPTAMRRACVIGLGDAAMLQGFYAKAHEHYEQARNITGSDVSQPEEMAKVGGYPFTVEDLLARGEYDWALKTIDQWESQFPTQKLEGYSFFLRGKVVFVEEPSDLALRYLDLAELVAPRAVHVPETVWLRANCLMALGRYEQALQEFLRIRNDYTQTDFFHRSAEKIDQCQKGLEAQLQ